jgi:hypothetical protein
MEELDLVKEQWAASRRGVKILRLAVGCLAAVLVALLLDPVSARWHRDPDRRHERSGTRVERSAPYFTTPTRRLRRSGFVQ